MAARPDTTAAALTFVGGLLATPACCAGSPRYCDAPQPLSAAQQDKLLRFAAVIKAELDASGARVAIVSRSGLELGRLGQRYSHAGVGLKADADLPWAVRQLYYACDEGQPRLFDQGMAAFVMGGDEPELGFVSVLLLPRAEADRLERSARDKRLALRLLGSQYSANAYPFSTRFQNCNQWLIELLATAWGPAPEVTAPDVAAPDIAIPDVESPGANGTGAARAQAQRWLQQRQYLPTLFDLRWRALMWLGAFIPWVHDEDHPPEDTHAKLYRVSMPESIEAFVRQQVPGTERLEFCLKGRQILLRRGWQPLPGHCEPEAGDRVVALD